MLQVQKILIVPLHDGSHASKSCSLQLLAPVQTVSVLEETTVLFRNIVDQMLGSIELSKSKLVMVFVVQCVEQISKEGMDLLQKKTIVRACRRTKKDLEGLECDTSSLVSNVTPLPFSSLVSNVAPLPFSSLVSQVLFTWRKRTAQNIEECLHLSVSNQF